MMANYWTLAAPAAKILLMQSRHRWLILLFLGLAAVFRLYGLNNVSPPGLEHDEVAHWLINLAILDGRHAVYFTEAYGHEAGYHYLQTAFMLLLGDNALALRLPSAFLGMLLVALVYALAGRLFGRDVALVAMGLTAVHFYPIFYSRLALRAIALPVLSALSAYFWWLWWPKRGGAMRYLVYSAVFAGLSLHTYMAARSVPIFYGLFCLYLAIFHWPACKERWRGIALFWLIYLLIAAPLIIYLQNNPTAEFRITEIDAPLQALRAGDVRPLLANGLKIAGLFGWQGDPLWRQYVAGQPLFEPVVALLFYGGVLWSLWRWRDGRYAFVLLWALASFTPSLATVDAPSTIRIVNILPILAIIPSLLIHKIGQLSTATGNLSTILRPVLLTIGLIFYTAWTAYSLFVVWPNDDEVMFVWQKALTETAVYLDSTANVGPVAIGGWSPGTMDPATMELTLRRSDLDLRYFGSDSETEPINTLILPAGEVVRLFHPTVRPLAPALQNKLAEWGALPQVETTFSHYTVDNHPFAGATAAGTAVFNNEIQLMSSELMADGLLTTWRVLATTSQARRFFAHALADDGNILAQHDNLDAPAAYWQPGDLILQFHPLPLTADIAAYRLGIYNPDSCPACQNLPTADGSEFVLIWP